jgi:hypothetical protein
MVKNKMNNKNPTNDVNSCPLQRKGEHKREKSHLEHYNAQKWANTKRGLASRSPWHMPFKK